MLKVLVVCGLLVASSAKLCCMEKIEVAPQERAAFVETEHTRIKLASIGKARAAEKAWKNAFEVSKIANDIWKDAYIADKRGLDTFDTLDRKADVADKIMRDAEIKAHMITAQARQLYQEIRDLGVAGISLSWTKVKKAEALYRKSFDQRAFFAEMYEEGEEVVV